MTTSERFYNTVLTYFIVSVMVVVPFSCLIAAAILHLTESFAAERAAIPLAVAPELA